MKHNYKWVFNMVVLIAAVLTISVTTLGVLATPIVMSIMYAWYWMFLYLGYLALILIAAILAARYNLFGKGAHCK